jgi:hypothetical protein
MALEFMQAGRNLVRAAACSAALVTATLAPAAPAHEHGTAKLDVVLDGSTLTVALESPLDNLVGFEHAPKNNKQRAALLQMEERLRAEDTLFQPDPAAGCRIKEATVEHPFQAGRKAAPRGHSDADASWVFTCAQPGALKQLEVRLFDVFPELKRLRTQRAGPSGQGAATLDKTNRSLAF